jgi:hypothetical protein
MRLTATSSTCATPTILSQALSTRGSRTARRDRGWPATVLPRSHRAWKRRTVPLLISRMWWVGYPPNSHARRLLIHKVEAVTRRCAPTNAPTFRRLSPDVSGCQVGNRARGQLNYRGFGIGGPRLPVGGRYAQPLRWVWTSWASLVRRFISQILRLRRLESLQELSLTSSRYPP